MGSKYVFKPDSNPAVGSYDPDKAMNQVSTRSKSAMIVRATSPYRRPKEIGPDPGQYTDDVVTFGKDVKSNINFGEKYKFKPDSNPPVGAYNVEEAYKHTKFTNRSVIITEDFIKEKRPKQYMPDPGQYMENVITFGKDVKTNINFGDKYKFKPDSNPPVGAYDVEGAEKHVKFNNRSVIIREETSPYRRPKEYGPDPGMYTEDVITFGKDVKTNINFGEKYKFKADSNPPVGAYDVEGAESKIKF